METIIMANFMVFLLVSGIGVFVGLDLKKWSSWLYGAYGFLSGFLMGQQAADAGQGIILGALFAFAVLFGGATTRWHRQRYK